MFGMIVGTLYGLYMTAAVISAAGTIIGAVFSGLGRLAEGAFSAEGIPLGIALGLVWYSLRRRNGAARSAEKI